MVVLNNNKMMKILIKARPKTITKATNELSTRNSTQADYTRQRENKRSDVTINPQVILSTPFLFPESSFPSQSSLKINVPVKASKGKALVFMGGEIRIKPPKKEMQIQKEHSGIFPFMVICYFLFRPILQANQTRDPTREW